MPAKFRGRGSYDPMRPTDDQLIAWYAAGELLQHVVRYFDLPGYECFREVSRRCGCLAAARKLDLLLLIESGLVAAVKGQSFFVVQQFYVEALPSLDEPVSRMLAAVDELVTLGGSDLAANSPNGALREWLRGDPARAESIISAAASPGSSAAHTHLTFALEATADPAQARSFLESEDSMLKASAMTALSRLQDPGPASRALSIRSVGASLGGDANDFLCASAVEAILAVANQDPLSLADLTVAALQVALASHGDGVLNRAANALWSYKVSTQPVISAVLLRALLELNPDQKGTINILDMGLKSLIEAGQDQAVVDFLATLLIKHRGRLKAQDFNSVWQEITSGSPVRLSRWVVTWLISGDSALGSAVCEVLSRLERDHIRLTIDCTALPVLPAELGYLARKAVGWFMLQPQLATSLLISVLSVCDAATAKDVAGLLEFPVLRNYPEIRDHLADLAIPDAAKPRVDAALHENESYTTALRAMVHIPELTPSDQHRRIQHLHRADQMQIARKEAQEQSVFLKLVRRSTLLYGNRSLTYLQDLDGGVRHPMEMELKTHEYSMALPRLDMLDPIGLQILLFRFRSEAKPN